VIIEGKMKYTPEFLEFWKSYPKKLGVSKMAAFKAYIRARQDTSQADIVQGLLRYPFKPDPQYQPHPATWLNQRRWEIEEDTAPPSTEPSTGRGAWRDAYDGGSRVQRRPAASGGLTIEGKTES